MILIGTPVYGNGYRPWYVGSLVETVAAMGELVRWCTKVTPYVAEGRDWIAAECLRVGAEGVLWIDADMAWRVDDVKLLIAEGLKRPGSVVGAFYPSRAGRDICIGAPLEFKDLRALLDRPSVEAHHLGFGFAWTPAEVLKKMGGPQWFPTFYRGGKFVGEDVGFCERAHGAGIPLYGMAGLSVGHAYEPGARTMAEWLRGWKPPEEAKDGE